MIKQSVLPFKLEITKDLITSHAGLGLLGEFAVGLGLNKALDEYLPGPGSGAGYCPSEHVFPLILMLNGGGRSLEDLREIRSDVGLREILPLGGMPSADATGDWLRRSWSNGGLEGLGRVNRMVLKRVLKREKVKGYTLDIDATAIESEKESAKMTYIGILAYNIGRSFILRALDESWHRHQVQLRWKLYGTAGKIVFHGRHVYLKVSRSLQRLFARVRLRSWEFAQS